MTDKSKLTLVSDPQEFFYELLTDAMKRQTYRPTPYTQVYLLNLLTQFMTTEALFMRDEEGNYRQEPLALMVKEAIETPHAEAQRLLFRQVGDVSLYVAGFFQDSLNRKLVDLDYYVHMGGAAYHSVAARAEETALRETFEELSHRFTTFVDILADVSDRTTLKSEKNLLELYDRWVRTKSERAARALQEAGIIPSDQIKKSIQ